METKRSFNYKTAFISSCALSVISIIISIGAFYSHSVENDMSESISILSVLVTVLVGWNILSFLSAKAELKDFKHQLEDAHEQI